MASQNRVKRHYSKDSRCEISLLGNVRHQILPESIANSQLSSICNCREYCPQSINFIWKAALIQKHPSTSLSRCWVTDFRWLWSIFIRISSACGTTKPLLRREQFDVTEYWQYIKDLSEWRYTHTHTHQNRSSLKRQFDNVCYLLLFGIIEYDIHIHTIISCQLSVTIHTSKSFKRFICCSL